MFSDSTTRAVATEAWSQLLFSIISNCPPSDMSRNYYYTYPERGFNYLEKQLKRLERYKYKLGTRNIQTRMRHNNLFMQGNECESHQGIEHIRACARSIKHSKVLQENEDENQQGIEHIRYFLISSKHSDMVQTNEDENHQGIDHIRECLRSSKHSEVGQENEEYLQGNENFQTSPRSVLHSELVKANEDEYQQGIEHIRYCLISSKHSEVVQMNEDVKQQGIEHIRDCLRSSKHSEMLRVRQDENHQGMDHSRDSPSFFVNSEFWLENEPENRRVINNILNCPRSSKHSEVVQKDGDKNLHRIEYFQEFQKSTKVSKVVQTNKDGNQQEIEHFQDKRLNMHSELEQENEHGNHIEHVRDSIKSTVSFKPAEFDDLKLINKFRQTAESTELPEAWQEPEDVHQQRVNYKEAKKLSTLFDELLDLIENEDLLREEKPTLRFQVLKVIKLLHHYGVDTIHRGVQNELEDVNLKSSGIEEDMALYYYTKGLEVMLKICKTETCQRAIYDLICKAERHQVFFT